jgi:hypothetical protein
MRLILTTATDRFSPYLNMRFNYQQNFRLQTKLLACNFYCSNDDRVLMKYLFAVFFVLAFMFTPIFAQAEEISTDKGTLHVSLTTDPAIPKINEQTKMKIDFINPNTNQIQEHIDYRLTVTRGDATVFGPTPLLHTTTGSLTVPVEFRQNGEHRIQVDVEGILFQPIPMETAMFTKIIGSTAGQPSDSENGGGCLIATAAYGTEMSSQVQLLREVRNNVLSTDSGMHFMTTFNSLYYMFSPTIADLERQNPLFKEVVRIAITPMLATLSILNYVDIQSEQQVLAYGIGIILLNSAIYLAVPAIIITKLRKK